MKFINEGLISLPRLPLEIEGNFDCSDNKLNNLIGSPEEIGGYFSCIRNRLTSLIGSPKYVGGYYSCSQNLLTSLFGAPKIVRNFFAFNSNYGLLDVSDLWSSDIDDSIHFTLNETMAILPLIKFIRIVCNNDVLTSIHQRNSGSSKENIIDFQYDLLENGFSEYAKWKP